jgi:hypothetical protein
VPLTDWVVKGSIVAATLLGHDVRSRALNSGLNFNARHVSG